MKRRRAPELDTSQRYLSGPFHVSVLNQRCWPGFRALPCGSVGAKGVLAAALLLFAAALSWDNLRIPGAVLLASDLVRHHVSLSRPAPPVPRRVRIFKPFRPRTLFALTSDGCWHQPHSS